MFDERNDILCVHVLSLLPTTSGSMQMCKFLPVLIIDQINLCANYYFFI